MKTFKNVLSILFWDLIILILLYITRVLVIIAGLFDRFLYIETIGPILFPTVFTAVISTIVYLINKRYLKVPNRHFIIAQIIFYISLMTVTFLALIAVGNAIGGML